MIKPIKPSEIINHKQIPDRVIEIFNNLIARNYVSGTATIVKQNEVVELLMGSGYSRNEIFNNHYLDIEELYSSQGWNVSYDKPGYNEFYEAFFCFIPKKLDK